METTHTHAPVVEALESRTLLSLNVPSNVNVTVQWEISTTTFGWHDDDPTNTQYVAQWRDTRASWIDDPAHTLPSATPDATGKNFTTTQAIDSGKKRYYRVKAVINGQGESGWSGQISPVMPEDQSVELQVTSVGSGGIQLGWREPETRGSTVAHIYYTVSRKLRGATSWTPVSSSNMENTTSWTDTSATANTAYEYQLYRKDADTRLCLKTLERRDRLS